MSQQPRHQGSNAEQDALRDARLAQALKHMPDAHMQPDPQARSAVLQAALEALDSAQATALNAPHAADSVPRGGGAHRWRKFWHWLSGEPGQRMPLSGALASLLIASLVTLMWYGQDVPDANPERLPNPAANHAGAADKAESASPNNTTADKAAEPPRATAAPQTRAMPPKAPAPFVPPAAPPMQRATPPPPALVAPSAVANTQAAADVPAPSPPAPAKESAAERSVSRLPNTQMAEIADAAKPLAKMTPAPAPMAQSATRARQEAIASPGLQIVLDGQLRTLTPAQSASLLAALRALPWRMESARADAANAIGGLMADSGVTLTVQTPHGDRWDINNGSVRTTKGGIANTSPITEAQWLQLRALAAPAVP